jgi:hypothetical protein
MLTVKIVGAFRQAIWDLIVDWGACAKVGFEPLLKSARRLICDPSATYETIFPQKKFFNLTKYFEPVWICEYKAQPSLVAGKQRSITKEWPSSPAYEWSFHT